MALVPIPGTNLPKPSFSRDNPYWRMRFAFIKPEFRPRLTAQDFLYATVWEINRPFDIVAACYVRKAVLDTYALNFEVLG